MLSGAAKTAAIPQVKKIRKPLSVASDQQVLNTIDYITVTVIK